MSVQTFLKLNWNYGVLKECFLVTTRLVMFVTAMNILSMISEVFLREGTVGKILGKSLLCCIFVMEIPVTVSNICQVYVSQLFYCLFSNCLISGLQGIKLNSYKRDFFLSGRTRESTKIWRIRTSASDWNVCIRIRWNRRSLDSETNEARTTTDSRFWRIQKI